MADKLCELMAHKALAVVFWAVEMSCSVPPVRFVPLFGRCSSCPGSTGGAPRNICCLFGGWIYWNISQTNFFFFFFYPVISVFKMCSADGSSPCSTTNSNSLFLLKDKLLSKNYFAFHGFYLLLVLLLSLLCTVMIIKWKNIPTVSSYCHLWS